MKRIKFGIIIWILFGVCAVLSACDNKKVVVDTELTVESDFSGQRTMSFFISEKEMKTATEISFGEINSLIQNNCPEGLNYSGREENGNYYFNIYLYFSSLENYKEKVKQLVGEQAEVEIRTPDHAFTTGVEVKENFSSLDMLSWLLDLLSSNGLADPKAMEQMLSSGKMTFCYDNKTYESIDTEVLDVSDLVEAPLKAVDILSSFAHNGLYDRMIRFRFYTENFEANPEEITRYFECLVPEGVTVRWEDGSQEKICVLEFSQVSWEQQNDLARAVFQGDGYVYASELTRKGLFTFGTVWDEYLDMNNYLTGSRKHLPVGYYVQWEEGIELQIQEPIGQGNYELKESVDYPGYYKVFEKEISTDQLVCSVEKIYHLSQIELSTQIKNAGQAERSVRLSFAQEPDDQEKEMIIERMSALMQESGTVKSKIEKKQFRIMLTCSGTLQEIREVFAQVFGGTEILNYRQDNTFTHIRQNASYEDQLSFSEFLMNNQLRTDILLSYKLRLPAGSEIVGDTVLSSVSLSGGEENIKEIFYDGSVPADYINLILTAKVLNWGYITVLSAGLIIIVVCLIWMFRTGRFGKIQQRVRDKVIQLNQAFEGNELEEELTEEQREDDV